MCKNVQAYVILFFLCNYMNSSCHAMAWLLTQKCARVHIEIWHLSLYIKLYECHATAVYMCKFRWMSHVTPWHVSSHIYVYTYTSTIYVYIYEQKYDICLYIWNCINETCHVTAGDHGVTAPTDVHLMVTFEWVLFHTIYKHYLRTSYTNS